MQVASLTKEGYVVKFFVEGGYRWHDQKSGYKPALNKEFNLFSGNLFISFIPSFVSGKIQRNTDKLTLGLCNFDEEIFRHLEFHVCEIVLCQISIFVGMQVTRVVKSISQISQSNYQEIPINGSLELRTVFFTKTLKAGSETKFRPGLRTT